MSLRLRRAEIGIFWKIALNNRYKVDTPAHKEGTRRHAPNIDQSADTSCDMLASPRSRPESLDE